MAAHITHHFNARMKGNLHVTSHLATNVKYLKRVAPAPPKFKLRFLVQS